MRIGIDLSSVTAERTGVGQYTCALVGALVQADGVRAVHGFSPATRIPADLFPASPKLELHAGAGGRRLPWLMRTLRREAGRIALDVFHFPNYFVTPRMPVPTVVTVHDMTAWMQPGLLPWRRRLAHRLLFPGSVARATRITTVSEISRRDLVARFPGTAGRVTITPEAPPPELRPCTDAGRLADLRRRYLLPPRYLFAVGAREPRKNLGRLVKAVAVLRTRGLPHPLVITSGAPHPPAWIDGVLDLGYVPAADLPGIYAQADAFAYPSLYEGFGLPPLEAMEFGTPVVASNAGAIPEVCGDAALLVDPLRVESLADALHRVLTDAPLREELRRRGIMRAASFSWAATARLTLEAYRAAVAAAPVGQ